MFSGGPLLLVTTISVLIHLAGLITYFHYGLATALNFIPPAAGSLLAIWLVRIGNALNTTPKQEAKPHGSAPSESQRQVL